MQVNARYRKFLLGGVMVMLLTSLTMIGASSPVSSIGEGPPPHNIHVITDNPEDPFPGTPYTAATLASASIEVKGIEALETGASVYDLVLAKGLLTAAELDEILQPEVLTQPRLLKK